MSESNITKNAIATALRRQMRTKSPEKITVSDICAECGINRKSFYYHFRDKYDLVNWIFYMDFLEKIKPEYYRNGWGAFDDLCRLFYEDRDFYRAALRVEGQNCLREYALETMRPLIRLYITKLYGDSVDASVFEFFFIDSLLTVIIRWLTSESVTPPEAFSSEFKRLFTLLAKQAISEIGDQADS